MMKKPGIAIVCIIAFFLFAGSIQPGAKTHVIKISSDPWRPWVLGNEGELAKGGIAVEIARELFKRIDMEVETKIYPYERCIRQMKTGERDVLLMAKKTKEREKFMVYTDVAARDPQLLYYSTERKKAFEWADWKDLKSYKVGIVRGFNYGGFGQAAEKHQIKTEVVSNDLQNVKKLIAGRIDLIILNKSTATYFMESNPEFKGKYKAASKIIAKGEFHFALSKKGNAAVHLSKINAALNKMKLDGTLDKIIGWNQ